MSPDDRNRFDRGLDDREFSDRGMDRGMDRGLDDRDLVAEDRQFAEAAELADRGLDDRALEQQLAESGREARL